MIVKEFNETLGEDLVMKSLQSELNEIDKSLDNLLKAVEKGMYTSLTQDRILELEKSKRKSEKKIARQQVIAIKPLDEKKVSEFIYSFASLDYTVANNRKRLIELFVRKAYCFKDKILIFYNASLDPKQEIKLEKNTENELLFVFGAHGGGMPRLITNSGAVSKRSKALYKSDTKKTYRKSHDNPNIKKVYEYLNELDKKEVHKMLHTSFKK